MMAMDHTERRRKKKVRQIQTGDDCDFNINHTDLLRQHLQKYKDGERHCEEKAQSNDTLHMLQQRSKEKEMHTWMFMQKRKGMRQRDDMMEAAQHTQT